MISSLDRLVVESIVIARSSSTGFNVDGTVKVVSLFPDFFYLSFSVIPPFPPCRAYFIYISLSCFLLSFLSKNNGPDMFAIS